MALILALGGLNYFGVKVGGEVQVLVTICKVGLILAVIVVGLGTGHGDVANFGSRSLRSRPRAARSPRFSRPWWRRCGLMTAGIT